MSGPYDYVEPSYWYQDKSKFGGAFGFNTETSPGAAPEQVPELKRFLPTSALWPPDNPDWNYHAGSQAFKDLHIFNQAMIDTYGAVEDIESYDRVAQAMTYDGERAMFEAYSGHRYTSTGVIQWMLNNAWPSLRWHLYDYYLVPGGGYYGAKKANEPVHIQYDYDQHAAYVVNSTLSDTSDMVATAEVFGPDLKPLFKKTATLDVVRGNSSQLAIDIPAAAWSGGAQFYFVRLALEKDAGVAVSRNFYWVPSPLTVFDWAKTTYIHTPATTPATMTELRKLTAGQRGRQGRALKVPRFWSASPTIQTGLLFSYRRKRLTTAATLFPWSSGTRTSLSLCRATQRYCRPEYRHPTEDELEGKALRLECGAN